MIWIFLFLSNPSGFISLDEFAEACELLKKHLPEHDTKEQLLEMCKMMDINKDGLVDLNEFLETFRLCEQAKGNYKKPELLQVDGGAKKSHAVLGSHFQKQSTEDDEEDLLLDCDIELSPPRKKESYSKGKKTAV